MIVVDCRPAFETQTRPQIALPQFGRAWIPIELGIRVSRASDIQDVDEIRDHVNEYIHFLMDPDGE